jgi:hypothetical protein
MLSSLSPPTQTVQVETCRELRDLLAGDGIAVVFADNSKSLVDVDGILNYLLDVAMLEGAAVFIGQGSSNLSRWVSFHFDAGLPRRLLVGEGSGGWVLPDHSLGAVSHSLGWLGVGCVCVWLLCGRWRFVVAG